jgi:hypothetical protein
MTDSKIKGLVVSTELVALCVLFFLLQNCLAGLFTPVGLGQTLLTRLPGNLLAAVGLTVLGDQAGIGLEDRRAHYVLGVSYVLGFLSVLDLISLLPRI